jgi:exopolyphosphatase/guanosine-5'-triphosphate,3'-diphosphate pyrophosphatase
VRDSGELDPAVEERVLTCLARFGQRIANIPESNVRAVGTNAMRRMKDGWKFLTAAETRLGHPIEIVSGQEEARLIYLGVAHGISERGQRLVIDIGGGSTEFIIGSDFSPIMLDSLYFGCVSIAQRFFADGKLTAKRWQKAKNHVGVELQRISEDFVACGWSEALGASGTLKAVRRAVMEQGWSQRGITPEAMRELEAYLLDVGRADRIRLEGVSDRRRPVFASGAVVVQTCLESLGIEQMIVTDYALREGLLYDKIGRILHADPRAGSVNALVERYRVDRRQGDRVRRTALVLFDQVAADWGLQAGLRDFLGWAADLHELGLTVSHHGYQHHGAYLLENSDLPGFTKLEQMLLATLVSNHRRKPQPGAFDRLVDRLQPPARRLACLLRLAVLLNRTRSGREPPSVDLAAKGDRLRMSFPKGWRRERPLTAADLEQEATQIAKLGIRIRAG